MVLHLVSSFLCAIVIFNQTPTEEAPADSLFPVEKYQYTQAGRRDPFEPLVGIEIGEGARVSHLSVENLTLVGVLWGDKGYYGLVKDGTNKGYILKKGDKVAGGYVASIDRGKIIFNIVHAGVQTQYELPLQEKERR